uniref:RING-type domain-containing protein n=1 Tax=Salix viminalis TaxID=40686 RepID=A0A6N2M8L0_SALVM
MDGPPVNDCCSICHGHFKIACQANCSHWFCGDCIMLVWHHGSVLQPCKCPLCRRQITLLVPGEASLRERSDPDVAEVIGKIERYNHLFGGNSSENARPSISSPEVVARNNESPKVTSFGHQGARDTKCHLHHQPCRHYSRRTFGIVGLLDDLLVVLICFLHVAAIYRALLYYRHGGS